MDGTWLPSKQEAPIIVIDNGSGVIKAGFAGEPSPRHCLLNCTAQPFGKRGSISTPQPCSVSTGFLTGDEIYSVPEYFCLRPHQYGLLMDANLEIMVWEKLFSKSLLNVSDFGSRSIIVTEQFNTPTAVRHLLTQIVFEEFGFERMVISPAQQLVPFAFTAAPESVPIDLWSSSSAVHLPTTKRRGTTNWDPVRSSVMGDSFNSRMMGENKSATQESFCQLVVDVGHQTSWVIPMYGELPLEMGALRVDIGGAHASALMKNMLAYQQVNLERSELLVHHVRRRVINI